MTYVFDPEVLRTHVLDVLGQPRETMFDALTESLAKTYPGKIYTGKREWMFNNAGGAMGQMTFLHSSFNEYLTFFGTPIGTEGHSGRYATGVWDFVLDGEMWGYAEGETDRVEVGPGDYHHLGVNAAKGYRIPDHCWMLEYSRGPILSMFPFGLADTLFSTLDVSVLGRTVGGYMRGVTNELLPPRYAAMLNGSKAAPSLR
jgi:hypothetical protein